MATSTIGPQLRQFSWGVWLVMLFSVLFTIWATIQMASYDELEQRQDEIRRYVGGAPGH